MLARHAPPALPSMLDSYLPSAAEPRCAVRWPRGAVRWRRGAVRWRRGAVRWRRGAVACLIACVLASGCAASTFDGTHFRKDGVAFRLEHLPPSWRQIEINDTALAFRDDEHETTVAINGRCGRDAEDVPLQSLTQHLFLQFTERQVESQQLMPLDGREALETQLVAKLDGVEKHFHVVVLKKDGCVYDFLQIASERQDPEAFRRFVSGFSSAS